MALWIMRTLLAAFMVLMLRLAAPWGPAIGCGLLLLVICWLTDYSRVSDNASANL